MVSLPRTCRHCYKKLLHYGSCNCTEARLEAIDTERKALKDRLRRLDDMENEALGLRVAALR
jgi:hypothetical protein